jgi:signal transduction histidine kinase
VTDLHDHVVKTMAIAVLTQEEGSRFTLTTPAPWVEGILPGIGQGDSLDVADRFPAIESFLPDAELAWSSGPHTVRRSEIWIERGDGDVELPMQAVALSHGDQRILLIETPWARYLEKLKILTTAREAKLEHGRLLKEIQKKEVLLHCIIHDLSGPLTAINGALSMLASKPLNDDARRLVTLGQRVAHDQERVIRDVLEGFWAELASPETMQLELDEMPDCLETANQVREDLEPSFAHRRVELRVACDIGQDAPCTAVIDRSSLVRILFNLTENALRHSPGGSVVTIRLSREGNSVQFGVEDEGPGVEPGLRERLFERFSRAGAAAGKMGLGLYFCRITVERWCGSIGHEDRPGGGSRFWIRLPAASPPGGAGEG